MTVLRFHLCRPVWRRRVQCLCSLITLSGSSRCKLGIKKANRHPPRWALEGFSKHAHQVLLSSWWKCLIAKRYNRCSSYYCFRAETSTTCAGALIITTPIPPQSLWLTPAGMVSRCFGSCLMVKSASHVHYYLSCSLFSVQLFSFLGYCRKCACLCWLWIRPYLSSLHICAFVLMQ